MYKSTPSFRLEKKLRKQGFEFVAGVDEAGRGALAGPIVAAAVILNLKQNYKGVNDSKKLTCQARIKYFDQIISDCICFSVAIRSHRYIDEVGLSKSNYHVLAEAARNLRINPDYILIDGFTLHEYKDKSDKVIKGDSISYSISAASIIAKVIRDGIMYNFDRKFPRYNFKNNKGYCTWEHLKYLKQYGICEIHRKSFKRIQAIRQLKLL